MIALCFHRARVRRYIWRIFLCEWYFTGLGVGAVWCIIVSGGYELTMFWVSFSHCWCDWDSGVRCGMIITLIHLMEYFAEGFSFILFIFFGRVGCVVHVFFLFGCFGRHC